MSIMDEKLRKRIEEALGPRYKKLLPVGPVGGSDLLRVVEFVVGDVERVIEEVNRRVAELTLRVESLEEIARCVEGDHGKDI